MEDPSSVGEVDTENTATIFQLGLGWWQAHIPWDSTLPMHFHVCFHNACDALKVLVRV